MNHDRFTSLVLGCQVCVCVCGGKIFFSKNLFFKVHHGNMYQYPENLVDRLES